MKTYEGILEKFDSDWYFRPGRCVRRKITTKMVNAYSGALVSFRALDPVCGVPCHVREVTILKRRKGSRIRVSDYQDNPIGAVKAIFGNIKVEEQFEMD